MHDTVLDLWSDDIKVSVMPPVVILKVQEGFLSRKTGGILQAQVSSVATETLVQHQFDIIAPSLNFYRERILSAQHAKAQYYPVYVKAECFDSPMEKSSSPLAIQLDRALEAARALDPGRISFRGQKAATEDEFIQLVRKVLQSDEVRSLIQSLIARINEAAAAKVPSDNGAEDAPAPTQESDVQKTPAGSVDQ